MINNPNNSTTDKQEVITLTKSVKKTNYPDTDNTENKITNPSLSLVYYHLTSITLTEPEENSLEHDWLKIVDRPDTPPELVAWARSWHVLKNMANRKSKDNIEIPNGSDEKRVGQTLKTFSKPKHFTIRQVGNSLVADDKPYFDNSQEDWKQGSPVAEIIAELDLVQISDSQSNWSETITNDSILKLPLHGSMNYLIKTNYIELVIEPIEKPEWAEGIGRDQFGLFVIIKEADLKTKLYWFIPGIYSYISSSDAKGQLSDNSLQSSVSISEKGELLSISKGFWMHENEFRDLLFSGFKKPEWADSAGIDSYGFYADLRISEITQRMRWINPRSFFMGTSEEESVRNDDEHLHLVILTKGYWLADTACTQELWNVVSETNPSCFRSKKNPVEGVCWEDCINFINKLNKMRTDINLRLPSEAEWEYACRAETTTPYNFGNNITPDQVNYDSRELFANGENEKFRNETVEVKSFSCNKWGLYEMHGNVWEWCSDFYSNYPEHISINPVGPQSGGSRILRGGAWNIGDRFTRSAYRLLNRPEISNDNHGFRLALSYDTEKVG